MSARVGARGSAGDSMHGLGAKALAVLPWALRA